MAIALKKVALPHFEAVGERPAIPATTYENRVNEAYKRAGVDWLAVYADREHFGNMVFLTGFEPRFEEAFLLLGPGGKRILLTGNESESYAIIAGLPGLEVAVSQTLSLMAQDRSKFPSFADRLCDIGLKSGDTIGLVGWKYLEPFEDEAYETAFFVPAVYVQAFARVVGQNGHLRDATAIIMHPEYGLASTIDADQIAVFEWGAMRASQSVWNIVAGAQPGEREYDAARRMGYMGETLNVHTMFASNSQGRDVVGLRSATARILKRGDGVTTAVGHWGALSSRAGLLDTENDTFLAIAKSYFEGLVSWYATAAIGVEGGAIYEAVVSKLAEHQLRSALNPGHLGGYEEWIHSPIRPNSTDRIKSGMPFQVDIIPTPVAAGWALNCEDPVIFADETLRTELAEKHPACAVRIEARRAFVRDQLGISFRDDILPTSNTPLMLAPFWMRSESVLIKE
ncbi:hypothetical protein M8R20_15705 [Pseudomonas sp. R2.Fl]|nr:hypothetical protein [Pseudomonas sp. R2.Fl]